MWTKEKCLARLVWLYTEAKALGYTPEEIQESILNTSFKLAMLHKED